MMEIESGICSNRCWGLQKVYKPLATFFEKGECNGMKFVLEVRDCPAAGCSCEGDDGS